jgi:uncharacterized protein YdeI (YjbR/CyaY-like superfamily)
MPKKAARRKKGPAPRTEGTAPRTLRRPLQAMPAFVRRALQERQLLAQYRQRPAYQRNDYLGWIGRAKLEETRLRRLEQMLTELAAGDRYMNMAWRPRGSA